MEKLYAFYSETHAQRSGVAYYRRLEDGAHIPVTCVCSQERGLDSYKWPDMKFVGLVGEYLGSCDQRMELHKSLCHPSFPPADRTAWQGILPGRDDVTDLGSAVEVQSLSPGRGVGTCGPSCSAAAAPERRLS